jgi:CHAD domain-containing protein
MKKKSTLSGKRLTLRSNGREILPLLLDSFLERIDPGISNEKHQEPLHALRLRGKRLRYAMEMYQPAYNPSFADCLDSVKDVLGIMGRIHDLDINLPILRQHVRQVRHFNGGIKDRTLKMPTAGLRTLIHRFEEERHERFLFLCDRLLQWKQEEFRQRFIQSIL